MQFYFTENFVHIKLLATLISFYDMNHTSLPALCKIGKNCCIMMKPMRVS